MSLDIVVENWQADRNWSDDTVIKFLTWFCEQQDKNAERKLNQFFREIADSEDSEWCEGESGKTSEDKDMYLPPYFDADEPPPF